MKKFMKKPVAIILAVVLLVGAVVGGTLAWFTDKTDEVVNTFTVGNVDIDLNETKEDFKMIPGWTIAKDPVVTVEAGSEATMLFVKLDKSANFDQFLTYAVADGWTALEGVTGVYWREVDKTTADVPFAVIKDNTVTVKESVTKEMMDAIVVGTADEPTLTVTAYATQLYKNNTDKFTPAQAWAVLFPATP